MLSALGLPSPPWGQLDFPTIRDKKNVWVMAKIHLPNEEPRKIIT
jgi:hypothetical protein